VRPARVAGARAALVLEQPVRRAAPADITATWVDGRQVAGGW
jgi:hypothetical protein